MCLVTNVQLHDLALSGTIKDGQAKAVEVISSDAVRKAVDLSAVDAKERERYGRNLFGQSVLAARRLVESGVRLVTVFWDEFKDANTAWDTHVQQIARLGIVRFYWRYLREYISLRRSGLSSAEAYQRISFETEAFAAEKPL